MRRFVRVIVRLAVVAIVAAVVKAFALDVYPVREQSMWPTLEGGRDAVLVDKLTPALGGLDRFDMCVFRHDAGAGKLLFVKRLLASGGEVIDFRGGDVFVGASGAEPERVVRSRALVEQQLVPVPPDRRPGAPSDPAGFDVAGGTVRADGRAFTLAPEGGGPVSAMLVAGRGADPHGIRDDRPAPDGTLVRGRHAVPDVRVTLGPVVAAGSFRLVHEIGGGDARGVTLDERGLVVTARTRGVDEEHAFPGENLGAGVRIETIDGTFRVLLPAGDGWRELHAGPRETSALDGESKVRFEAAGGPARVSWLEVARDVHYVWGDSPANTYPIAAGRLFLVGDNPEVSRDSRDAAFGAVLEGDLVGVVRAVVWPRLRFPE